MRKEQLQYFLEIAETSSFTKAAENLFITQAGLTYQIKQLESELGFELFSRSSHGVALTEQGHLLRPAVEHIAEIWREAYQAAAAVQQNVTTFNVGIFEYLNEESIFAVNREFRELHPGTVVVPHCMKPAAHREYIGSLISSKIDVIFIYEDEIGSASSVAFQPLSLLNQGVLVRRNDPLATVGQSLTFEDLAGRTVLLPSSLLQNENSLRYESFIRRISSIQPQPQIIYLPDRTSMRFMVEDIGAVEILPYAAGAAPQGSRFAVIPIDDGAPPTYIGIGYLRQNTNQLIRDYVNLCQEKMTGKESL